jgi:hypothetical protein
MESALHGEEYFTKVYGKINKASVFHFGKKASGAFLPADTAFQLYFSQSKGFVPVWATPGE